MTNAMIAAAQAVVDRWDTPAWKDVEHTAVFINRLRAALAAAAAPKAEPVPVGEYPPLPEAYDVGTGGGAAFSGQQMRAYVDADRAMRAQAAPQPAAPQGDVAGEPGWLQRLRDEQRELAERYDSLSKFIESYAFPLLDATQQSLLERQVNQQHALLQTLNQRINSATERFLRSKSHE